MNSQLLTVIFFPMDSEVQESNYFLELTSSTFLGSLLSSGENITRSTQLLDLSSGFHR